MKPALFRSPVMFSRTLALVSSRSPSLRAVRKLALVAHGSVRTLSDAARHAGRVKFWSEDRGYGFIVPLDGGEDIFVHRSSLNGQQSLAADQQVSYILSWSEKRRKPAASDVDAQVPWEADGANNTRDQLAVTSAPPAHGITADDATPNVVNTHRGLGMTAAEMAPKAATGTVEEDRSPSLLKQSQLPETRSSPSSVIVGDSTPKAVNTHRDLGMTTEEMAPKAATGTVEEERSHSLLKQSQLPETRSSPSSITVDDATPKVVNKHSDLSMIAEEMPPKAANGIAEEERGPSLLKQLQLRALEQQHTQVSDPCAGTQTAPSAQIAAPQLPSEPMRVEPLQVPVDASIEQRLHLMTEHMEQLRLQGLQNQQLLLQGVYAIVQQQAQQTANLERALLAIAEKMGNPVVSIPSSGNPTLGQLGHQMMPQEESGTSASSQLLRKVQSSISIAESSNDEGGSTKNVDQSSANDQTIRSEAAGSQKMQAMTSSTGQSRAQEEEMEKKDSNAMLARSRLASEVQQTCTSVDKQARQMGITEVKESITNSVEGVEIPESRDAIPNKTEEKHESQESPKEALPAKVQDKQASEKEDSSLSKMEGKHKVQESPKEALPSKVQDKQENLPETVLEREQSPGSASSHGKEQQDSVMSRRHSQDGQTSVSESPVAQANAASSECISSPTTSAGLAFHLVGSFNDWSAGQEHVVPCSLVVRWTAPKVGGGDMRREEFQMLGDGDWDKRVFPAGGSHEETVLVRLGQPSPASEGDAKNSGHGRNWVVQGRPGTKFKISYDPEEKAVRCEKM